MIEVVTMRRVILFIALSSIVGSFGVPFAQAGAPLTTSIPITNVTAEDANTFLVPDPLFPRSCGDLWPQAWADDGNVYAANGDGVAFGWRPTDIKVSRLVGDGPPDDLTGKAIPFAFGRRLARVWPPKQWQVSRKPTGMICVDGVLYLFYQNL